MYYIPGTKPSFSPSAGQKRQEDCRKELKAIASAYRRVKTALQSLKILQHLRRNAREYLFLSTRILVSPFKTTTPQTRVSAWHAYQPQISLLSEFIYLPATSNVLKTARYPRAVLPHAFLVSHRNSLTAHEVFPSSSQSFSPFFPFPFPWQKSY